MLRVPTAVMAAPGVPSAERPVPAVMLRVPGVTVPVALITTVEVVEEMLTLSPAVRVLTA
jgi:hypothetical protein